MADDPRRLGADDEPREPRDPAGQEKGSSGRRPRARRLTVAAAVLVVAALVALALWWFGVGPFAGGPAPGAERGRDGPVAVAVTTVRRERIPVYYEYNAQLFSSRQADIRPRVSGYIEEIAFAEGADVERGELLYQLDARPFEAALRQARARREAVEASLAFAEAQVARLEELVDDGFASGERYDQALARREELEAELGVVEAAIEAAAQDLDYTSVTAPFSGRLGLSRLNEGELASPGGAPLTTLVQLDPIEVRFEVREDELPAIRRAAAGAAPVRVVALLDDEAAYAEEGALEALDNAIDPTTGTLTALALFPNPEKLLTPGRFVQARLILGEADALLVPTAALSTNLDRRIVYRVGPDGRAVGTPVRLGRRQGERVVVTGGLSPGDRVVVSNLQAVREGVPLAVDDDAPAEPTPPPRNEETEPAPPGDAADPPGPRPPPLGPEPTEPVAPSGRGVEVTPGDGAAPGPAGGGAGGAPLVGDGGAGSSRPSAPAPAGGGGDGGAVP